VIPFVWYLVTSISQEPATCTFKQEVVISVEKSVCNTGSASWDRAISNPMGAISEVGKREEGKGGKNQEMEVEEKWE
jgi:hypothetical protein